MHINHGDKLNRRNLLLGSTGLLVGLSGCQSKSPKAAKIQRINSGLKRFPALRTYIESMCPIPEASFLMGTKNQKRDDEYPEHRVTISSFHMGKTPVTVSMWEEFCKHSSTVMPPTPSPTFNYVSRFNIGWADKDHPIVNISWIDCQRFAYWASKFSGMKLTLPSEAQFEYACRGGKEGLDYPWGNDFDKSKLWCSKHKLGDKGSTGSVTRTSNIWLDHPWHLIDIIGNVEEWCQDWYDDNWYRNPQSMQADPVNHNSSYLITLEYPEKPTADLPVRCVRSGSWADDEAEEFRVSKRYWMEPTDTSVTTGFRLVASVR